MFREVKYFAAVFYFASLMLVPLSAVGHAQEDPSTLTTVSDLIMSEIKVRYDSTSATDYDEFIELYNPTTEPIDLSKYTLAYFNKTNPDSGQLPTQVALGPGFLAAGEHVVFTTQSTQIINSQTLPFSSLSDSGGRLRLLDATGDVIDEVAWSSTQSLATLAGTYPPIVYVCTTSSASCISRTQSMQREKDVLGAYVLAAPTWSLGVPSPQSSKLVEPPIVVPEGPEGNEIQEPEPIPALTCEGVRLSELLPNPGGSDAGNEFIEIHNPTDEFISMDGCSLQVDTKLYNFAGLGLSPRQHYALSDVTTGLTLPNSAGGTVWLLSPTDELDSVVYPGGLDDDVAWALINNVWQITYVPSPSGSNISQPLKPCPEGQFRNTETNRCQASVILAAANELAPCGPGLERNPATNRCRSVMQNTSSLVPCREGQERNPETNRCRAIAASATLTPCDEGQERNPETNRCRKVAGADGETLAAVQDVKSGDLSDSPRWWAVGLVLLAVVSYGVYEWRRDVANWLASVKARFGR